MNNEEKLLKEAKEVAKEEATDIINNLKFTARLYDYEPIWFIEEVIKQLNQLKQNLE